MWRQFFGKRNTERDLDDELHQYITEAIQNKVAAGMPPDAARRAALLEFGGVEQVKEIMRESRRDAWMDAFCRDVGYAFRIFRKSPSFAVLVILTSALGIAAATASFSFVDAVLVRPLPYNDSDRLVQIWATIPILRNDPVASAVWDQFDPGYAGYQEFRQRQKSFERVGAFLIEQASVVQPGDPRPIHLGRAAPVVFEILHVPPVRGRVILDSDGRPDTPAIAVLGYEMWIRDFGGDPNVLGRRIVIQSYRFRAPVRAEYTIAGVLPRGFRLPVHDQDRRTDADLWTPLSNSGIAETPSQDFEILGQLKRGASITNAEKETSSIFSELPPDPTWPPELHMKLGARVSYWREQEAAPLRKSIMLVFAATGLLLLIACGNVANLLLDRAVGRRHEITLRAALGASRGRIMMQLIVESTVLSMAGGILGVMFGAWVIRAAVRLVPVAAPYGGFAVDLRVLAFAIVCSILTGVLFGLLPALVSGNVRLESSLKESAANRASHRHRLQHMMIVAEISLSFVLMVAAALIARSLVRLTAMNPGFRSEHLLTLKLQLPPSRYGGGDRIESFYRDLFSRLSSLPGVEAITARQGTPFANYHSVGVDSDVVPEGAQPGTLPPAIENRAVLPNYFEVLGIPFTDGRSFTQAEVTKGRPHAVVVNKTMARMFWPGHPALNRRLLGGTVVGVVDDPKEFSLGEKQQPVYYMPTRPDRDDLTVLLRTTAESEPMASAIRTQVRAIDPELPVFRLETMDNLISASHNAERDRTVLVSAFASTAVLLVLVGLYGVISRSVGQRTRELGIRIAIGASPRQVLWLVLRQSLYLAIAGVLIGSLATVAATRLITSFLFGITATDVPTYSMIAAGLITMSIAATYVPARRAARIDPADCLRAE
jgi:predicted permease